MVDVAPTVIVSRRVRPGAEREFTRWSARVVATAQRFEGHLMSELQPPSDAHPGEWTTIYRFASVAELDAWLDSPERAVLMAEGERLLEGPVSEQRLLEPVAGPAAVTAVLSQRIRPGAHEEFRRVQARMARAMERFEGFLRCDLLEPIPGVQDDHVIVFSFASKRQLDRWLASPQRQELLREVAPLLEGDRTLSVVGGFAGWFRAAGGPKPVRWKQAVAVLLALYPTTLTLGLFQRWLVPDVPWAAALLVSNVVGVAILTWFLMPLVTRWLGGWLRR